MRKHWQAAVLFGLAAVFAIAGSIYVFLWFVSDAQSTGLVPSTLGLWTMSHLVNFIIYAVFWEVLIIGIPVAIAAIAAWKWWTRIPRDEWKGLRFTGRKRSTGGGGGSLLFFIVFCIKVYIDGNWHVPIATFTLDYVVGSMITILVWGLIIFGIPAAIGLTWWVNREMKKPQ